MANRSYLYSIDFDATKGERKNGEKIFGLSEFAYYIPLSFKILVSQDAQVSNSIIWDNEHPIAIQGNFEKGKRKLLDFLAQLQNKKFFNRTELNKQITETLEFLNSHQLQNIILENGEIYDMLEKKIEDQNKQFFKEEIINIDRQIDEYFNHFETMSADIENLKKEISDLSRPKGFLPKLLSSYNSVKVQALEEKVKDINLEMWNMLGINYWSDILYFHFDNE